MKLKLVVCDGGRRALPVTVELVAVVVARNCKSSNADMPLQPASYSWQLKHPARPASKEASRNTCMIALRARTMRESRNSAGIKAITVEGLSSTLLNSQKSKHVSTARVCTKKPGTSDSGGADCLSRTIPRTQKVSRVKISESQKCKVQRHQENVQEAQAVQEFEELRLARLED